MCKFFYKSIIIGITCTGLLTLVFFLCGFSTYRTCEIEGVNISGLTEEVAIQKIEKAMQVELQKKKLVIKIANDMYTFTTPQLYYKTNVREVYKLVHNKKGKFPLKKVLCLTNLEETLRGICDNHYQKSIDATILFHGANTTNLPTFQYTRDRKGCYVNGKKLLADVEKALDNNFSHKKVIVAEIIEKAASFQLKDAKSHTKLLASFCTYFAVNNTARVHNITLASQKINGSILQPNEVFSFNKTTGPRTQENGFQEAHIIKEGEFVNGLGGGVCQVSTTIYNCALLAGLKICEYHPHSLNVGYVAPSFDAMVSGSFCDLKFKNCNANPVYISCRVQDNQLRVEIYGLPTGVTYARESVVLEKILPEEPEIRFGEEAEIIREEKEGLRSEGYLIIEKNGVIERKKIRTDKYNAVQGIIQVVPSDIQAPQEESNIVKQEDNL